MADRFFSIHTDEPTSFSNYTPCLQSTGMVPQQISSTVTRLADYDLNTSTYYISGAVDVNKNSICNPNVDSSEFKSALMISYLGNQTNYNKTGSNQTLHQPSPSSLPSVLNHTVQTLPQCQYGHNTINGCLNRNRYMPYNHNRLCAAAASATVSPLSLGNPVTSANSTSLQFQHHVPIYNKYLASSISQTNGGGRIFDNVIDQDFAYARVVSGVSPSSVNNTSTTCLSSAKSSINNGKSLTVGNVSSHVTNGNLPGNDVSQVVTLQINNLDYSMDEITLRNFLLNQLKPITPVVSLVFEGSSFAKVTVPNLNFAKQVVAHLHRKKIGHKRMIVSYTRDSSLTEFNTLRCQVAGLLKDVPYYTLPMYKFRELFQSRFKTSISVLDLYKMQDICSINSDNNDEKFISLQPELFNSINSSPLMEGLQHSVPYCTIHFKREQHKGWAEQEIEPLPNVFMTISDIQQIIYPLLKGHPGDIPVSSLVHCIEGELNIQIKKNENGVNLEHLVCCVHGIQINTNSFGNKILGWLEPETAIGKESGDGRFYAKNASVSDPLYQISREVVELIKMSPKSTMKFNRFIPAYHNHFGKQCRVADYGYTKLIELFEALSTVVQIMGDGENRQITLTHRTQVRRFTSDLLRILRALGNKSVLLSQLPLIFSQIQHRSFDITDYGVCNIVDILDGLANSNIVSVSTVQNGKDILISIPQRKQTPAEIEKTSIFAGEVVELFRNAPQYSILFQKFVRSYHYHFAYQCRLSDYGFFKLADLMESIQGVVEMETNNDEDKKVFLSPKVARRVFSEQLEELIREFTGSSKTCMKLDEVLELHKKKFGYNIQPQALGVADIIEGISLLPFIEVLQNDNNIWIICHNDDAIFRTQCYRSCYIIQEHGRDQIPINDFINLFSLKFEETLSENSIAAMKHAVEIVEQNDTKLVKISAFMKFLIEVVQFLDHRTLLLSEIKNALNAECVNCFQYGYPNLYIILRAHPDTFSVNIGTTQDRSEVSLISQSELALLFTSRNCTQDNSQKQCSKKQASKLRPQRLPLSESNRNSLTKSSTNTQKMLITNKVQTHLYSKPTSVITKEPQSIAPISDSSNQTTISCFNNKLNNNLGTSNVKTTSISYNNKENSFNNSGLSTSFNSSLNSFPNLNTSTGSASTITSEEYSKLWNHRQVNYYNSTANNNNDQSTCVFELNNSIQMCPVYEPPKPDTPPSDAMPFWIDPIWSNSNVEKPSKFNSLNIKLPEFKTFNILPMLLSPYTLSKTENMKQQIFNFENHDRKIA